MRAAAPAPTVQPSIRAIPSEDEIVRMYNVKGLVHTAREYKVNPSTLAARLRRWGVELHGRGWKPWLANGSYKPLGDRDTQISQGRDTRRPSCAVILEGLAHSLCQMEGVITRSAEDWVESPGGKPYLAGKLEMLRIVQIMVSQTRAASDPGEASGQVGV